MDNLIIRKAMPADIETLLVFEQGIILTERPFDPTLKREHTCYYNIEKMISATDVELVVAEWNGELIGSGYARIEMAKPYLKHHHYAYLGFMYIVPAFRGMGINKQIITALEIWAASKSITELRLDVYYANDAAVKAYEKAGFNKHMIAMRKGLIP